CGTRAGSLPLDRVVLDASGTLHGDGPRGSLSLAGDAHLRLTSVPRDDVDVHLPELAHQLVDRVDVDLGEIHVHAALAQTCLQARSGEDRKSTRLNSSHEWISYGVL